jgi:hypothetical protein
MSIRIGIGLDVFSKSSGNDADAEAFFARVTAAGGTLSGTEKTAVNQLVLDMKSANIWTSMKAVYPMVGASAAACAQNLKSSSFTGTFNGGWTFASTGVTPNGTNAYMTTNFIVNTEQSSANDFTLGVYSGSIGSGSGIRCSLGAYNGTIETIITISFSNNYAYLIINDNTYVNAFANSDTHGFYVSNRNTLNKLQSWKNGIKITDFTAIPPSKQTNQLYLGAENGPSTPISYDNKRNQFAFMGNGITDAQQNNYYTLVQAFQTTLSRNI